MTIAQVPKPVRHAQAAVVAQVANQVQGAQAAAVSQAPEPVRYAWYYNKLDLNIGRYISLMHELCKYHKQPAIVMIYT